MPPKNITLGSGSLNFGTMCLSNIETGEEKTFKVNDIQELSLECDERPDYDEVLCPGRKMLTLQNKEATMNIDFNSSIDTEKLYDLIGFDSSKMPDAYDIGFQKLVQIRKHKKRRINKKWAKRYGYKTVTYISKEWNLHMNTDGTFEFTKKDLVD